MNLKENLKNSYVSKWIQAAERSEAYKVTEKNIYFMKTTKKKKRH